MKSFLIIPLAACISAAAVHAQYVNYSQFFNNGTGSAGDTSLADYGWVAYIGSGADVHIGGGVDLGHEAGVSQGTTSPDNRLTPGTQFYGSTNGGFAFVVQNPAASPNAGGYFMATESLGVQSTPFLNRDPNWFSESTLPLAGRVFDELTRLSVRASPGTANIPEIRFGVKLNGVWYASESGITVVNGWVVYDLDPAASNWFQGVLSPGALELAPAGPLVSGASLAGMTVEGFGLHVVITDPAASGGQTRLRLDMMQVEAIPEPSTWAAIAGVFALGLVAWRRRRSR